jgi:hydrogenase maturation protease
VGTKSKVAILGIGNILLRDEGVGIHVINALKDKYKFPESVRLIDGGTMGLDLLPFLEDSEKVLIIDAVDFRKEPGAINIITGETIPSFFNSKLSVHQIGLSDILFISKLMKVNLPELCLIGIQPKSIEIGTELSEEIHARLEVLLAQVLQKLREWGIKAIPKKSEYC